MHNKYVANTEFYWQGMRLLGENQNGLKSLYIYENTESYEPLARIEGEKDKEKISYFHTNLAGLPEQLIDETGNTIWQAEFELWGNAREEWHNNKSNFKQNLRNQGQYLDRETGLHYNTFRYYNPDIGRFTQPDPIGLLGRHNLYQYAPNPISWIDPWGWAKCGTDRKNITPTKKNPNIDHSKTTVHPDGSTTYYDFHGNSVTYSKDGVPDFSPYAEKVVVTDKLTGNRVNDNKVANQAAGLGDSRKAPDDKVWHHVETDPIILMDKTIHSTFPHTGSASVIIHG